MQRLTMFTVRLPCLLHTIKWTLANSHCASTTWTRRLAIFDQFPGTEHIECGAILQRRPGAAQADRGACSAGGA